MPTIRISDRNYERLQRWAKPFEDTVDDVLSRVLDIAESVNSVPEAKASSQTHQVGLTAQTEQRPPINANLLLAEFEEWLLNHPRIKFVHAKKTMNTYLLEVPRVKGRRQPKVFVPSNGSSRLYLPISDYSAIDPDKRVIYKRPINQAGNLVGWNIYPQFIVRTPEDVKLAKELIDFALNNF